MRAVPPQTAGMGWGFLVLGVLALGGLLTPAQARPLAEIKQTKELRVCMAPIRPSSSVATPPGCRDNCTFSGPVYEEVRAFAATLGQDIQLKFLRIDWDEQFHNRDGITDREASYTPELLASGTCDFYPNNVTKNAWRLKKLDFVTLYPVRMVVVVNKTHKTRFQTPADLAGKVASITENTSQHTWLGEQNGNMYAANPVLMRFMIMDDAIKAVDAGAVDFTVVNADAAIWATRHQYKNIVVAFSVGPIEETGWAFRKEDTDLQAAVQAFFEADKAMATSTLNQIWERAFGLTLTKFEGIIRATK